MWELPSIDGKMKDVNATTDRLPLTHRRGFYLVERGFCEWIATRELERFKGEKAVEVAKLKSCLASNLQNLQEDSYQPCWNEIKDLDRTGEWPKFVAPAPRVSMAPRQKPAPLDMPILAINRR